MIFDEEYYGTDLKRADYSHYQLRADWIQAHYAGKRVIELGCGFGAVIAKLRQAGIVAWGVDRSTYAIQETYAPGFVFEATAQDYKNQLKKQDFIISWNFLDCLTDEAEADLVAEAIETADTNYHILCMDNGDPESQNYKDNGYFIKPASYWLALFSSDVVLIDYHTRQVFNNGGAPLKIPLSWNLISE